MQMIMTMAHEVKRSIDQIRFFEMKKNVSHENENLFKFKCPIRDVQIAKRGLERGIYIGRILSTKCTIYIVHIHKLQCLPNCNWHYIIMSKEF